MNGNNNLYNVNKSDNTSRIMFAVICLLVILIAALCLYMFVFSKSGDTGDETSESVSESSSSQQNGESEESSLSAEDNSTDTSGAISEPVSGEPSSETVSGETSGDASQAGTETSEGDTSGEITEHGWVVNNLGYTYLYYGIGLEQFTYSTAILNKYVSSLDSLRSVSGSSKFYHILVPTRSEFIDFTKEIKDEFYNANQRQFMTTVFEDTADGITNIDLYDAFKTKYTNSEYIYYNTDPNYTHIAAYEAYAEFCKAAGITAVSDSLYTLKTVEYPFYGKFYTATGSEMLYDNADMVYYYDIDEVYSSQESIYKSSGVVKKDGVIFFDVPSYCYYCFLGDEAWKMEVTTKANTGKSILVIGDSSAAPFVTFLVPHYDKITYINTTICSDSIKDLLSSGNYNDIVVINYTTSACRTIYAAQNGLAGVTAD